MPTFTRPRARHIIYLAYAVNTAVQIAALQEAWLSTSPLTTTAPRLIILGGAFAICFGALAVTLLAQESMLPSSQAWAMGILHAPIIVLSIPLGVISLYSASSETALVRTNDTWIVRGVLLLILLLQLAADWFVYSSAVRKWRKARAS